MSNYEKLNFTSGQVLKAEHLNHMEEGITGVLPTAEGNEKYLAVDKDGNLIWEDRYGYTYYEESILCPEQSDSSTFVIYGSVFVQDCVIGETYEVICNGVTYSAVCKDYNGLSALGNLKLIGAGEDTGEVFCIAGANVGIATLGFVDASIAQELNTLEVRGKKEIITHIPSKYLGGGLALGSGNSSCAMNGIPPSSVNGTKSFAVNSGITNNSHAFASGSSKADGAFSFASGWSNIATGDYSAVFNSNNKAKGRDSFACGDVTTASGDAQFVCGRRNIEDTENKYIQIVGNGSSVTGSAPSNAHTVDWTGNGWFSGDVYVGSTSGTNKDEGSKKLATEDFVRALVEEKLAALINAEEVSY